MRSPILTEGGGEISVTVLTRIHILGLVLLLTASASEAQMEGCAFELPPICKGFPEPGLFGDSYHLICLSSDGTFAETDIPLAGTGEDHSTLDPMKIDLPSVFTHEMGLPEDRDLNSGCPPLDPQSPEMSKKNQL